MLIRCCCILAALVLVGCQDRGPRQSANSQMPSPLVRSPSLFAYEPPRPMMVNFTRDFCLPCQVMAPRIEEVRSAHVGKIDVVDVHLDREGMDKFALFFQIDAVPSRVYVDSKGSVAGVQQDTCSREDLERSLRGFGWIQ